MKINPASQKHREFKILADILGAKPFPECESKTEFTIYAGALCGLVVLYNSESWLTEEAEEIKERFYDGLFGFYLKLSTGKIKGWLSRNEYKYEKAVGDYLRDAFKSGEIKEPLRLMQQYETETALAIEIMKIIKDANKING